MKKFIVSIIVTLCFGVTVANGATVDFTLGSSVVNVLNDDLSVKTTDALPVCNDTVFIPVRIAVESFDATVFWYGDERKVKIVSDGVDVSFVVGDCNIEVNEDTVKLDTPTFIVDNRTMVPLQFFESCMGYNVRIVDVTNQIILTDDMPVMRVDESYIYYDEVKLLFDADKDKYNGEEELLVKSCISNLYDTAIMYNNAVVKHINFTEEDNTEILRKAEADEVLYENTSLKSIYLNILSKRKLADKFSDWLSNNSIPDDKEIYEYFDQNFQGNELTDELYEEIRYLLGYEKFVENWNNLYANTEDEMFYDVSKLTEMLK